MASPFELSDVRVPQKQKWRVLGLLIGSCNYGIYSLGDTLVGGRVERLEAQLRERFGARLDGHRLVVEQHDLFQNAQISLTQVTGAAHGGIVGAMLERTAKPNCPLEKTKGGWYDPSLVRGPAPPYVVEIRASFDGQPLTARAARSAETVYPGAWFSAKAMAYPDNVKALAEVQAEANADLMTQIERLLPKA